MFIYHQPPPDQKVERFAPTIHEINNITTNILNAKTEDEIRIYYNYFVQNRETIILRVLQLYVYLVSGNPFIVKASDGAPISRSLVSYCKRSQFFLSFF